MLKKYRLLLSFIIIFNICFTQIAFSGQNPDPQTVIISARVVSSSDPIPETGNQSISGSYVNIPAVINFSGVSAPFSKIFILGDGKIIKTSSTDKNGNFFVSTTIFSSGGYNFSLYSESLAGDKSMFFSIPIYIKLGTIVDISNIKLPFGVKEFPVHIDECLYMIGDLNCDKRVNFSDFTIMSFWYKRYDFPQIVDLNKDKKVDLIDFSIMMFYWTD